MYSLPVQVGLQIARFYQLLITVIKKYFPAQLLTYISYVNITSRDDVQGKQVSPWEAIDGIKLTGRQQNLQVSCVFSLQAISSVCKQAVDLTLLYVQCTNLEILFLMTFFNDKSMGSQNKFSVVAKMATLGNPRKLDKSKMATRTHLEN